MLREITDKYVQENFKRIEKALKELDAGTGGDIINNITNLISECAWGKVEDLVNASSTKAVDSVTFTEFTRAEYVISVYNDTEVKYRSFKMSVAKKGSGVVDSIKGRHGDNISFNINANIVGPNVELTIQNNETYNLSVSIRKLTL